MEEKEKRLTSPEELVGLLLRSRSMTKTDHTATTAVPVIFVGKKLCAEGNLAMRFFMFGIVALAMAISYFAANYRSIVFTAEDPLAAKIDLPENLSSLSSLHGLFSISRTMNL
jgi:hypothetical protein